jgi:transcriptional regulator with XRE-family HTH domain
MGTSQEYISRIELGLTAIRIDTLNRLAHVLGCHVEISLTLGGR